MKPKQKYNKEEKNAYKRVIPKDQLDCVVAVSEDYKKMSEFVAYYEFKGPSQMRTIIKHLTPTAKADLIRVCLKELPTSDVDPSEQKRLIKFLETFKQ